MSKIREIRESIDTKLDILDKHASALEAQLTQSKERKREGIS